MKNKIKVALCFIAVIAIILVTLFFCMGRTHSYKAIIERNGIQKEATITLTYDFFAKCRGYLNGTALVETKDGERSVEFTLDGPITDLRDRYASSGYVWAGVGSDWVPEEEQFQCYFISLLFDKGFDNIVIYSYIKEDKYFIYSATEEFLNSGLVEDIREKCAQ